MKTATWIISSALFFLATAKAHGRELRLERVAAGIERVVFGGDNPPFVEALWRAERVRFWIVAPIAAALVGYLLRSKGLPAGLTAVGALLWGPAIAFVSLGLWSLARTPLPRGGFGGSIAWWALAGVLGCVSALAVAGAMRSA